MNRADLHADRTADAVRFRNTGFLRFIVEAQSRAACRQALLTADADFRIDGARCHIEVEFFFIFFGELLEDAGPLGDDDRRFIFDCIRPVEGFFHDFEVQRIDGADILNTQGFDDRFDIDEGSRFAFDLSLIHI